MPLTVIAEPVETDTGAAEDQAPDGIIGESMEFVDGSAIDGIVEVESLREENAKHFKLTDGTYEMVVYGDAVHRKDADGNWQDIDNNLALQTVSGNQLYSTGDLRTSFAKAFVPNTTLFTLNENGYSISMALVSDTLSLETGNLTMDATDEAVLNAVAAEATVANAPERSESKTYSSVQEAAEINNRSSISYSNVRANTDIEYVLTGNDIKENIIVKQQGGNYDYEFKITLVGLSAVLNDDNTVTFIDKTDAQEKYMIPLPYMYDANGEVSYDVQYGLESLGNDTYILSVSADEGWINAAERAFPVVIDPTVIKTMLYDTYIDSSNPASSYGSSDKLWVSSTRTTFVRGFLPALPEGATFHEAYLYAAYYYYDSVTTGYVTVGVYQALESWNEVGHTWNYANTMNNLGLSTTLVTTQNLSATVGATADAPQWMEFDITTAVASWYNGSQDYGVALKYDGGTNGSVILYSSESGEDYEPFYSIRYTYYIPDGVYALKNLGNSGLWMDTQYDSSESGMHMQQYAYTSSPTETFSRGGLFKISRVSGTERYIIRLMTNNNLTFEISGTDVITKEISSADSDVSIYDTFNIYYDNTGFTLSPYASTYWIKAYNTTASGSSGAPDSYLTVESQDNSSSAWARWQLVQYTGVNRGGAILYFPTEIIEGEAATFSAKVWSTTINANSPYIYIDSSYEDMAESVWFSELKKLTIYPKSSGDVGINVGIQKDGTNQYSVSFVKTIEDNMDPLYKDNIKFIRYTDITTDSTSHLLTVIGSSIGGDDIFIVKNMLNGLSRSYLISDDLINDLHALEDAYQSYLLPFSQSSIEESAAHAAKGETDQLVDAGYITYGSSEYYGAWASNYNEELQILHTLTQYVNTYTAIYSVYMAATTYYYSHFINNYYTVSATQYNSTVTHIDDIASDLTNNPGSTKVMLGTDDGVTTWYNIGADEGMTYFYTPNWNSYVGEYGDEMMKAANQEFLYRQKLAGKQFYFSHDPMVTLTQYPNSSFAMELNWLKETYGLN